MKKIYLILVTIATAINSLSGQTPGSPDATFNIEDQGYLVTGGSIYDMLVQPDGKLLIGGTFQFGGCHPGLLARLNANDKKYDETFNPGGSGPTYGAGVYAMTLQPDNKIIIAGGFTDYNGITAHYLARLNADGTFDNSFNAGAGPSWNSQGGEIALQNNGKIILAGNIPSYDGHSVNNIVRVNTDGSYDNTFNQGTGADQPIYSLAVQSDNKIVITGGFTTYDGNVANHIARLNADGSFDNTFVTGSGLNTNGSNKKNIVIQSSGKIIVSGGFTNYNGNAVKGFVRLNTDGTFDASFNSGGSGPGPGAVTVQDGGLALENDDKIFIIGSFTTYNGVARKYLAKLNADGSLDNSFNPAYTAGNYFVVVGADGRPSVYCGYSYLSDINGNNATLRNITARYTASGGVEDMGSGTGPSSDVYAVKIQNDGKILVGGRFAAYNGTLVYGIARTNSDGSRDASFNPGSTFSPAFVAAGTCCGYFFTNRPVYSIAVQADSKILIGTRDATGGGTMMRLDGTTGSLDGTFTSLPLNGDVYSTAIQSDNKIIIAGSFYNLGTDSCIARLNTDGTIDNTFTGHTIGGIKCVGIQSDGKMIIGGTFSVYQGATVGYVIRINTDGTRDNTFNTGGNGANGDVYSVAIQPDGKILIGGYFTSYNGVTHVKIARLNADGTLDNTFSGNGFDSGSIVSIALQSDGKILAGGTFSTYNGTQSNGIVRINTNGTIDGGFYQGTGFNDSPINAIAVQNNGNIVVGGKQSICSYNGQHKMGLYRIYGGCIPCTSPTITGPNAVCQMTTGTYTATSTGATSYTWTVPTGLTITSGQGTATLNVNIGGGTINGNVTATATNACGTSTVTNYLITKKPQTPANISGPTDVCGLTSATYSIPATFGATSYAWVVPAGITISGGQGTTSINVTIASTFTTGGIKVSAVNACGSIPGTILAVYGKAAPNVLTGPNNVCGMTTATYTCNTVANATGYFWIIPSTWTFTGQGTNSIVATMPANVNNITYSGTVKVHAVSACGNSADKAMTVSYCKSSISMNGGAGEESSISIYPNPATGQLTVNSEQVTVKEIQMYNVLGECVFKSELNNNQSTIDIQQLKAGMYFVRLSNADNNVVYSERVIKQ